MSRQRGRKCGTVSGYRGGCRCIECREAKKLSMRDYVARVAARDGLTPTQKIRGIAVTSPCSGCSKPMHRTSVGSPRCTKCRARDVRSVALKAEVRQALYARDSWICQFCHEPVPVEAPRNSPWEATLDHIVPRSLGGTDDLENLRLTHRYCNAIRSNKPALTLDELAS